jgi:hypothetical protein
MEYDAADDLLITLLPRTGGRPYAFGAGVLSPVTTRVENYCHESARLNPRKGGTARSL